MTRSSSKKGRACVGPCPCPRSSVGETDEEPPFDFDGFYRVT